MLISLKYLKVLRCVSILIDHHQGVCLYLANVTEYLKIKKKLKNLKNTQFKIPTINSGVVAAIHVKGVRGDPCGSVRCTTLQGSERTPAICIVATTPELMVGILNSVFLKFF